MTPTATTNRSQSNQPALEQFSSAPNLFTLVSHMNDFIDDDILEADELDLLPTRLSHSTDATKVFTPVSFGGEEISTMKSPHSSFHLGHTDTLQFNPFLNKTDQESINTTNSPTPLIKLNSAKTDHSTSKQPTGSLSQASPHDHHKSPTITINGTRGLRSPMSPAPTQLHSALPLSTPVTPIELHQLPIETVPTAMLTTEKKTPYDISKYFDEFATEGDVPLHVSSSPIKETRKNDSATPRVSLASQDKIPHNSMLSENMIDKSAPASNSALIRVSISKSQSSMDDSLIPRSSSNISDERVLVPSKGLTRQFSYSDLDDLVSLTSNLETNPSSKPLTPRQSSDKNTQIFNLKHLVDSEFNTLLDSTESSHLSKPVDSARAKTSHDISRVIQIGGSSSFDNKSGDHQTSLPMTPAIQESTTKKPSPPTKMLQTTNSRKIESSTVTSSLGYFEYHRDQNNNLQAHQNSSHLNKDSNIRSITPVRQTSSTPIIMKSTANPLPNSTIHSTVGRNTSNGGISQPYRVQYKLSNITNMSSPSTPHLGSIPSSPMASTPSQNKSKRSHTPEASPITHSTTNSGSASRILDLTESPIKSFSRPSTPSSE